MKSTTTILLGNAEAIVGVQPVAIRLMIVLVSATSSAEESIKAVDDSIAFPSLDLVIAQDLS